MSTFPSATFSPTDEWEKNQNHKTQEKSQERKSEKRRKTDFKLNEDRNIYLIIFSLPLPGKHQTYKTEQRSYYTHNSWNVTTRNIFFHILYMRPLPGANFPALGNGCRFFAPFLACVAGVNWGRGRGNSGARGGGNSERLQWRFKLMFPTYPPHAPLAPSRARIHVFPSPINACHAGAYLFPRGEPNVMVYKRSIRRGQTANCCCW